MTGKEKCRILRNIRRKIAQANDIPFPEDECDYEGDDCSGTCTVCDMELRYLERELKQRRENDQKVSVERIYEEELQFRAAQMPVPAEDPEDIVMLEILPSEGPGKEDWEDMFLKLSMAGIATVNELQEFTADELTSKCGLTKLQLEAVEQLLHSRGRTLKRGRRRDGVRGRMRSRHGYF